MNLSAVLFQNVAVGPHPYPHCPFLPQAESIIFTIVQAPRHGAIERTGNSQHFRQTSSFTMDDIYQNRISYNHDGSNSLKDRFTFTVADGTNLLFMVDDGGKEVACGRV